MSGRNFGFVVVACALGLVTVAGEKASAQSIVFDSTGTTDEKNGAIFGFTMKDLGTKRMAVSWLSDVTINRVDLTSKASTAYVVATQKGTITISDGCGYVLKAGKYVVTMTVTLDDGTKVKGSATIDFQKIACEFSSGHGEELGSAQILLPGAKREGSSGDLTVFSPPFSTRR
jgi:methionine-rich copper-binding protein CopC